jgi:hypothetical protein
LDQVSEKKDYAIIKKHLQCIGQTWQYIHTYAYVYVFYPEKKTRVSKSRPKWANSQAFLLTKQSHFLSQGKLILPPHLIVCFVALIDSGARLAIFQVQETARQINIQG